MSDDLSDHPAYWDWCPLCRHGLDTGLECSNCGYDMMPASKALSDIDTLKSENERLRKALREAREAFFIIAHHPIKHDPLAYAVVRGIAETAIDDADAALNTLKINHLG